MAGKHGLSVACEWARCELAHKSLAAE